MRFWFSGPRIFGIRTGVSIPVGERRRQQQGQKPRVSIPANQEQNQQPKADLVQGSFVYVVHNGDNLVKVGVTTNPSARIAQMRAESDVPVNFVFIGVTPGSGHDIGAKAQEILAEHRCAGEWLDVSPELAMAAVTGAAGKLGQPLRPIDEATAAKVLQIAAKGGLSDAPAPEEDGSLGRLAAFSMIGLALSGLAAFEINAGMDRDTTIGANVLAFFILYWLVTRIQRALA